MGWMGGERGGEVGNIDHGTPDIEIVINIF